jgi:hypothetical protein
MDQTHSHSLTGYSVEISRGDRWQAYHRLQDLGVSCTCLTNGSLVADINSPIAAVQLWSVVRQLTTSRQHLSDALEQCWQLPGRSSGFES